MWLELDDDIALAHVIPSIEICAVLESIALSSLVGKHVLYGSRDILKWMGEQELSRAAKATISRAHSRVAEYGALRSQVDVKVVIHGPPLEIYSHDNVWHISISSLVGDALAGADLLVENLSDGEAYKIAAQHYIKSVKLNGVRSFVELRNGGGNEIIRCFRAAIDRKNGFTLAVTDGDVEYPEGAEGASSRLCKEMADAQNWVSRHQKLPCREIENLLPFNLLDDSIIDALPETTDLIPRLEKLKQAIRIRPEVHKYTDFKKSTVGYFCTDSDVNEIRRSFWKSVVNSIGAVSSVGCEGHCRVGDHRECECKVIEGVGEQTLVRFLEYCQKISVTKQFERMHTSSNKEGWLQMGRAVFMWGMADQPLRV